MKLDILLPTSLSEIPLSRYQKFIEMKEQSNDEEFIANKMIQIFCGIELKEVMQIKVKELNGLIKHFTDVFSEKPQLVRQQNEVTKMTHSLNTQNEANLANAGAGIHQSINALQEISPSLMKSPEQDLLNVSPILPSKSKKRKSKTANLKDK